MKKKLQKILEVFWDFFFVFTGNLESSFMHTFAFLKTLLLVFSIFLTESRVTELNILFALPLALGDVCFSLLFSSVSIGTPGIPSHSLTSFASASVTYNRKTFLLFDGIIRRVYYRKFSCWPASLKNGQYPIGEEYL